MYKLLSLLSFSMLVFTGNCLQANDRFAQILYENTPARFIVVTPPGWNPAPTEEPFTLKYVNDEKTVECYLLLSSFKRVVTQTDLLSRNVLAIRSLYGNPMFMDKGFNIVFSDRNDTCEFLNFTFENESQMQHITAYTYTVQVENHYGTSSLIIQNITPNNAPLLETYAAQLDILEKFVKHIDFTE